MKSTKIDSNLARVAEQEFQISAFCSALEFRWDSSYTFAGERHNFWEAVFVAEGEVESVEDGRVYRLRRGDLLFHAPMEFHTIRSAGQTTPHVFVMSFYANGEVPSSLKSGIFPLSEEKAAEYLCIFRQIHAFYHGETALYQPQLCVMELSAFLIRLSMEEGRARLSQAVSAKVFRQAVKAMQKRLYQNCTLTELAADCHVSVSYLKVLFERYAGISPKSYYGKLRYDESVRLLRENRSVAEVAELMNFSSPNYFSAYFKRYAGKPPARWCRERE